MLSRIGLIRVLVISLLLLPSGGLIARSHDDRDADSDEVGEPYMVFHDECNDFWDSGVMPAGKAVARDDKWDKNPYKGEYCSRARYQVNDFPWVGVSYRLDGSDAPTRTFNLYERLGCKPGTPIVLRFYARSDQAVKLKVHYGGDKKDSQAFPIEKVVRLSPRWQRYQLDLTKADTSAVHSIFAWFLERGNLGSDAKLAEIFLDEIYVTRVKEAPRGDG